MRESFRINKTFACSCGETYNLEISTDVNLKYLVVEGECAKCGGKMSITHESLLTNRSVENREGEVEEVEYDSGGGSYGSDALQELDSLEEEGSEVTGMNIFD